MNIAATTERATVVCISICNFENLIKTFVEEQYTQLERKFCIYIICIFYVKVMRMCVSVVLTFLIRMAS